MWRQDTVDNFQPRERSYKKTEQNLVVRIHPTGKKVYYAYVNRKDKFLGNFEDITLKQARLLRDNLLQETRAGIKENTKLTFKEFIETKDFQDWSVVNRTSHDERMKSLYGVVVPILGDIKLGNINQQAITRYTNHRSSIDGASNSTIERNLTDIRAVLRCAYDFEYINKLIKIKPLKIDKGKQPRALTSKEITKLREAVSGKGLSEYHANKQKHMPLIIEIALETGARKSEILTLTWNDLKTKDSKWEEIEVIPLSEETDELPDVEELKEDHKMLVESLSDNCMLHLRGLVTKSRQTRLVPITPSLYNRLISYYLDTAVTDEEFLEFNKDNYSDPTQMKSSRRINPIHKHKRIFSMNDIKTSFNKAKRKAGLDEEITFHSLRHTFCSRALDYMNIDDVKKFAGHSDIRTTQQYVHMNQEEAIKKHTAYAESIRPDNLTKTGSSD
jgi:integrase